jgi:hypothetical protein
MTVRKKTEDKPALTIVSDVDAAPLESKLETSAVEQAERLDAPAPPAGGLQAKAQLGPEQQAALDQEEADFRALSLDDDDDGTANAGIAAISIVKVPDREQFFRTNPDFVFRLYMAITQQGLNTAFLGVTKNMVEPMLSIGIRCYPHRLYLTISKTGGLRLVPVRIDSDNSWTTSKEQGLVQGLSFWTRIAADEDAGMYRDFPLPAGAYPDPIWPALTVPKIIHLALRTKGRLVDTIDHPYFVRLLTGKEPTKPMVDTAL